MPGREKPTGGLNKEQRAVMDEAIAVLKAQGAVIVDPADIPSVLAPTRGRQPRRLGRVLRHRRRQGTGRGLLDRSSSTA